MHLQKKQKNTTNADSKLPSVDLSGVRFEERSSLEIAGTDILSSLANPHSQPSPPRLQQHHRQRSGLASLHELLHRDAGCCIRARDDGSPVAPRRQPQQQQPAAAAASAAAAAAVNDAAVVAPWLFVKAEKGVENEEEVGVWGGGHCRC